MTSRSSSWRKVGSAVLMGVAVPVMHYTGMAAASFTSAPLMADTSRAVSISTVGVVGITSVTLMVLAFVILTSIIDRRFSSQTLELESSEHRYRMLFERSLAGVYRSTIDGRILDVNEACFRIFGYASREEHLAHNASEMWFDPADREAVRRPAHPAEEPRQFRMPLPAQGRHAGVGARERDAARGRARRARPSSKAP